MDQIRNVVGQGFLHTFAFVVIDRMDAQVQLLSDHFAAKPLMAQADNLHLAVRQGGVKGVGVNFGENLLVSLLGRIAENGKDNGLIGLDICYFGKNFQVKHRQGLITGEDKSSLMHKLRNASIQVDVSVIEYEPVIGKIHKRLSI